MDDAPHHVQGVVAYRVSPTGRASTTAAEVLATDRARADLGRVAELRRQVRPPRQCGWCGHVFGFLEFQPDHRLWCGRRPADA